MNADASDVALLKSNAGIVRNDCIVENVEANVVPREVSNFGKDFIETAELNAFDQSVTADVSNNGICLKL